VDQDDWEELRTAIEIIQSCTPQLWGAFVFD
jgi:hypothetical protein